MRTCSPGGCCVCAAAKCSLCKDTPSDLRTVSCTTCVSLPSCGLLTDCTCTLLAKQRSTFDCCLSLVTRLWLLHLLLLIPHWSYSPTTLSTSLMAAAFKQNTYTWESRIDIEAIVAINKGKESRSTQTIQKVLPWWHLRIKGAEMMFLVQVESEHYSDAT